MENPHLYRTVPKARITIAATNRGQDKRLSDRHQPHGTRQFQIVVGLLQDKVLINK